jgi:hypothetical protein
MQRFDRRWGSVLALAAALPLLAACAGDSINFIPKPDLRPDWLSYSGHKEEFTLRQAGAADLIGPDGQCAAGRPEQAAEPAPGAPAAVGISLQMTECDVVKRAGQVEKIDFGADADGQRSVVMTYLQGPWPGIYRFTAGRLVSIERAPAPPPAPAPAKKGAPKKPTGT